jgi:pimeloyl-ACP methyl ester carboxylesterase
MKDRAARVPRDPGLRVGPPLVLVMGYGWTMEGWDTALGLVHALALHHRVVMFDNSGAGRTQELPQPFSVDAMADQTSALITALGPGDGTDHLRRVRCRSSRDGRVGLACIRPDDHPAWPATPKIA